MRSSSIQFTKMHALGNDFIIINALFSPFKILPSNISQLSNRHLGIGFDQLLVIESSKEADFFCRIYNADGSEAEQCGNGLRCVTRFLHEEGLEKRTEFSIETIAGVFPVTIHNYDHIEIFLRAPQIEKSLTELKFKNHEPVLVSILSLGNPHAIIVVPSSANTDISTLEHLVADHPTFNRGVNVGFMEIINAHHIKLRTRERGVGETYACGSNACAAAVAGIINKWLESPINVQFHYGSLIIEWDGKNLLRMTGSASRVFSGEIHLPQIS